jgi:hypothetical protein
LPKLSTVIETKELSPSLAFSAAYFSVSSIGTRLANIQETYTEDGFTGNATFSVPIPDTDSRLEVILGVNSAAPKINLEMSNGDKNKLRVYLDEIAKRVKSTISRFSNAPGARLAQASRAVLVERKLDEALDQLLTAPEYQKVYVLVADARERLIRLGGVFEPATLQMSAILTPLAGQAGPIPKKVHEDLALDLLRWKKRIKQLVESLLSETEEE